MGARRYITELTDGAVVDAVFAIRSRELRTARTGDPYLALELADRTGSIGAVLFRPGNAASALPVGSVARVRGRVTSFRSVRRISVDSMAPAKSWSRSELVASGPRSRDEMVAHLRELVTSVGDPELRSLLTSVFGDRRLFSEFCECPASQSHHHAYLGGLLEHTLAVADACRALAPTYPGVDADLLLTAALLHDIGKVRELSFDTTIEYTDAGRLVGHVVMCVQMLGHYVSKVAIERNKVVRLEHAILSHHGELEWGSPKRPSTVEALLLHHADNLDAKASGFLSALQAASSLDEPWTDSFNLFRRPLFAPAPFEDDRPHPPAEDLQHMRVSA